MKPRIGLTVSPSVHDERSVEALNRVYVDAVLGAGGLPFLLPVLDPTDADAVLEGLDGLLLTGGGDIEPARYGAPRQPETGDVDPARDAYELALAHSAAKRGLPVMGICRGMQLLNVAHGGTLMQHLPHVSTQAHRERERFDEIIHEVELLAGSRVAQVMGDELVGVNSIHHQAIAEIGLGLRPVGWAPDGVIEAVEGMGHQPLLAVQWHPELLPDRAGHPELFAWLVDVSRQRPASALADMVA